MIAWQPVFDQLFPTDQWYVASAALEHGDARLTWDAPNQTERYGVALLISAGEIYGNQVIRNLVNPLSTGAQIVKLPAPVKYGINTR